MNTKQAQTIVISSLVALILGYVAAIWLIPSPADRGPAAKTPAPAQRSIDAGDKDDHPPRPPAGLDPLEQLLLKQKAKVANLEDRLSRTERVVAVQIQQIRQLQRISFGIGAPNDPQVSTPVETPPELKDSFGAIGDAPPTK